MKMDNKKREAIEKELSRLYAMENRLSASQVVDAAKPAKSPLHSWFVWDDTKAAGEYRLIQARQLIRRFNVQVEGREERLVHVPSLDTDDESDTREGYYRTGSAIVKSPSEYALAVAECMKRFRSAQESLKQLERLAVAELGADKAVPNFEVAMKALDTARQAIAQILPEDGMEL